MSMIILIETEDGIEAVATNLLDADGRETEAFEDAVAVVGLMDDGTWLSALLEDCQINLETMH